MSSVPTSSAGARDGLAGPDSLTRSYAVFGGVLRSTLPFPDLDAAADDTRVDWSFRVGDGAPDALDAPVLGERQIGPERYRLLRLAHGFRLEYSHAGVFDLDTRAGAITWYPGAPSEEQIELARAITLGPALGLLLEAAGDLCLHGSAVELAEGAVAFVAPKHHGKSTLGMALARVGARFVSDDTLAIGPGRPAMLRPGVSSARLWSDTASALRVDELCERVTDGIKTTASGFARSARTHRAVPLAAVYLIQPVPDAETTAAAWRTPMPPTAGAATMAQQAKLPDTLVGYAAAGRRLAAAVRVAATTPVYTLHVTRSFARLAEVAETIVSWHGGVPASETTP